MPIRIKITGESLDLSDFIEVSSGYSDKRGVRLFPTVELGADVRRRIKRSRAVLERALKNGEPIYGVNTGVGKNKDRIIPLLELESYQDNFVRAHCAGVGDYLPNHIVRGAILHRLNTFARGHSGVTLELCERLALMLNENFIPLVPSRGSLGASGDLIPLAHIAAGITGEKNALILFGDKVLRAPEAYSHARRKLGTDFRPLKLGAKEAVALTNGTSISVSLLCHGIRDSNIILRAATLAGAMGLEAIRGEREASDDRLHKSRGDPNQREIARSVRDTLVGSRWLGVEARRLFNKAAGAGYPISRIQDAYSFRCIPQVHGAVLGAIRYAQSVAETELNASSDNPLVFEAKGKSEVLSGGNFHCQAIAFALDQLAIALTTLSVICDRRIFALLNPELSYGLPRNLTGFSGSDGILTGLMILQYLTASLVAENRVLATPASIGSITTSGDQEDIVSMSATSGIKLMQVIENTRAVVAAELIASCQAILNCKALDGFKKLPMGRETSKVLGIVLKTVPAIKNFDKRDRPLSQEVRDISLLIEEGVFDSE